jgi:hypothetical protein
MNLFFSLRDQHQSKLDDYNHIIKTCNQAHVKNKRKIYSWQETDPIEKSLNNILNKLSDTNHEQIFVDINKLFTVLSLDTFKDDDIDEERILKIHYYVCYTLISRAIIDIKYIELYAKLCKSIVNKHGEKLRDIIIKVSEHLFYHEIVKTNSLGKLFKFLAYMYTETVLSKEIMTYILDTLYTLESYDKICDIINLLDKDDFSFHYNLMIELSKNKLLPNKIRFKIMDILEI